MREAVKVALFVLFLVASAGCGGGSGRELPEPAELEARYQEAMKLEEAGERDRALVKIIVDAAALGDMALVQKSLQGIKSQDYHDAAAMGVVTVLEKAGKREEARTVAEAIKNRDDRQGTLESLSEAQ